MLVTVTLVSAPSLVIDFSEVFSGYSEGAFESILYINHSLT